MVGAEIWERDGKEEEKEVYWSQVMSCLDFIPSAVGDTGGLKAGNDRITLWLRKYNMVAAQRVQRECREG